MMKENLLLMREARTLLAGDWKKAALATLVYLFLTGFSVAFPQQMRIFGSVIILIIAGPLALGYTRIAVNILRREEFSVETLFDGFRDFVRAFVATLLIGILIGLFMLLLIVPGIIVSLCFSMTYFILLEDRSVGAWDAMMRSREMMQGYKWKFFCLNLRFIGWFILSILTLGIGLLWTVPYMRVTFANFYMDLKENQNQ